MASLQSTLACLAAMTVVWTAVGWPLATRLFPGPGGAWLAPALGFAVQSALALPLFGLIGMGRTAVLVVTAACLAGAVVALREGRAFRLPRPFPWLPAAAIAAAALLALVPAAAALPKVTAEGVTLAASMFDHAKIALVDEMIRSGVPPHNPFVGPFTGPFIGTGEAGGANRVAYYYLWHFGAALFAVLTGASGWEADAALTGFTGFASLLAMMGLARRLGAGPAAPFLVLVLAASASLRPLLDMLAPSLIDTVILGASGLGGWLFQTAWAPQHLASATSVVLAGALLARLARPAGDGSGGWLAAVAFGVVAAAAYQSSIWVGGIVLAASAAAIALSLLAALPAAARPGFALRVGAGAALAVALSLPFLLDQAAVAALRGGGAPVALAPVGVLGPAVPEGLRTLLDLPAFWLVYLPLEFAAVYPAGLIGLVVLVRRRRAGEPQDDLVLALALTVVASSPSPGCCAAPWPGTTTSAGGPSCRRCCCWSCSPQPSISAVARRGGPGRGRLRRAGRRAGGTRHGRTGARGPVRLADADRAGVRRRAGPVAGGAAARGGGRARGQQPGAAGRGHAVAGQHLVGADGRPPLLLRRRQPGHRLRRRRPGRAGRDRGAVRARVRRRAAARRPRGAGRRATAAPSCVLTPQDGAWKHDPFADSGLYRLVDSRDDAWRIYRAASQMPANQLKPRSSQ